MKERRRQGGPPATDTQGAVPVAAPPGAQPARRVVTLRVISPEPEPHVSCTECAKCCTYAAVGINAPNRLRWATDILWYLYHDRTFVYLDGEGEWSVMFESRCRNLGEDNLCRIYDHRPELCREFDDQDCEVNCRESDAITFTRPEQFLAWLAENQPRVYPQVRRRFVPPGMVAPQGRVAYRGRFAVRARRARG
jgi:Fe-S-cluster containining protein